MSMNDATIDRDWIASEFSKGVDAEHSMATDAQARADAPPEPELGTLYREIATADERHCTIVETIAVRYGHTPSHGGGGIGEALGRLKDKVGEIGSTLQERLASDLATKANAIHWYEAWVATFEAIGDTAGSRELASVLIEEKAHRDALQLWLNRIVTRGAKAEKAPTAS